MTKVEMEQEIERLRELLREESENRKMAMRLYRDAILTIEIQKELLARKESA